VFAAQGAQAPLERQHAAAVFCGSAMAEQWSAKPEPVDFYDVKTVLDAALARIGLQADYAPAALSHLHPGRSANVLVDGHLVGVIGALHPALNKALDLPGDVYAFEIDLSALPKRQLPEAQPVSRFPSVRRDLALLVPEAMNWAEIEACSHRTLGPRLHSASLFDVYRGAGLPVGTKSLAMGLILHEYSRTLNDSEIEQSMAELLTALAQDCQATLRA
jgi:phenylalanyl-tRNA synthetase beta chain